MDAKRVRIDRLESADRRRVVELPRLRETHLARLVQPGDVRLERRKKWRLDFRIGEALEDVMHIARDDLAAFAAGKTRVVMKVNVALEPAEITHRAVSVRFLFR